jgi:predicted GIY-YIG superfamily endonuclease
MLYLLKFEPAFQHAQYYLGYCKDGTFSRRLNQHLSGRGAKIVRAAIEAGHNISVAFTCPGDAKREARLKKWNNNGRVLKHLIKKGWNE